MYRAESFPEEAPVIAIVGAGASGTLTAVQLLREAGRRGLPVHVGLIDRHGRHARGQAYSTTHPEHLLNTPATAMSAVPGSADHLVRWARDKGIAYEGFLPRSAYGDYLSELLSSEERRAQPLARLARLTSQVVGIRRGCGRRALRLDLAAEGRVDADIAILATGNLTPGWAVPGGAAARFIPDPWEPGALRQAADGSPVVVVGSGLTMVDVAIALTSANQRTTVHAVSRHGLLPNVHRWPARPGVSGRDPAVVPVTAPVRLRSLIRDVRCAAERASDWQDVIEALRPSIPRLWEQLPDQDKRQFLRHVARYWEVHRHRMAPGTARQLSTLRSQGRVTLQRGSVVAAHETDGGIRVAIEYGRSRTELSAGWLVNCSGPSADITATRDPLIRSLLAQDAARPDPLRLGLDADAQGAVRDAEGVTRGDIYAIGPLLRGVRYETTAIAEIRDQAAALAHNLVTGWSQAGPRSAA
jgi:uncharacterized NAD(P)/FAD-binding protein YdhS